MPQLSEIRYFVAAAENGSLRQAAETLGIGQSCVSRSIMRLEDKLGVSLLERSNTGVRLTNAGQRFLDDVQPALQQLDQARRSAGAAGRAEAGTVRIGVLTSLAGGFLRKLLVVYRQEYPKVRIDVRDGGRDEHIAALRTRELDMVFVPGSRPVRNCECAELWCERIHIALARGHRLASRSDLDWPDLSEELFITSSIAPGPEVHDYIVRRLADYAIFPRVEARGACFETLVNLVSLGEGLTATTAAWAAVKLPDLVLRPLADPEDVLPFSAIWLAENDNPALRCLVSTAHVLAGRVRRGNSDWLPRRLDVKASVDVTSADARRRDRSP
ncbi:LysR family transcriptional regulator [Hoeflea alexandrii]|uniref:LysR family transcriptional regulator n=1 Tax=Hoeflea alexandrii TaxID=288436 RepID=UPI0022AFC42F|nr:LysR family transcriptional regulator [Hoeflea alexandrii]MCZ4292243.1 LysR family transcriptional regulator [Hoeflea alexandrii]